MMLETATLWTFHPDGTVHRKVMALPDLTQVLVDEDVDMHDMIRRQVRRWRAQEVTDRCRERARAYFHHLTRAGVALSLAGAPMSWRDPLFAGLGRLERGRA